MWRDIRFLIMLRMMELLLSCWSKADQHIHISYNPFHLVLGNSMTYPPAHLLHHWLASVHWFTSGIKSGYSGSNILVTNGRCPAPETSCVPSQGFLGGHYHETLTTLNKDNLTTLFFTADYNQVLNPQLPMTIQSTKPTRC